MADHDERTRDGGARDHPVEIGEDVRELVWMRAGVAPCQTCTVIGTGAGDVRDLREHGRPAQRRRGDACFEHDSRRTAAGGDHVQPPAADIDERARADIEPRAAPGPDGLVQDAGGSEHEKGDRKDHHGRCFGRRCPFYRASEAAPQTRRGWWGGVRGVCRWSLALVEAGGVTARRLSGPPGIASP